MPSYEFPAVNGITIDQDHKNRDTTRILLKEYLELLKVVADCPRCLNEFKRRLKEKQQ